MKFLHFCWIYCELGSGCTNQFFDRYPKRLGKGFVSQVDIPFTVFYEDKIGIEVDDHLKKCTLLFEGQWYPNPLAFATSVQPDELALRAIIGKA